MFSQLDNVIFPDSCEVVRCSSQLCVYPIFKNGSSSINESVEEKGWEIVRDYDIENINTPIRVYVRDAQQRFVSGVNTFVQHNSNLDLKTALWFVREYPFLNRHFAPQFFWIINLARFMHYDTKIEIRSVDDIAKITSRYSDAGILPASEEFTREFESLDWNHMRLYYYLDQILTDLVGQTVTYPELVAIVRDQHTSLFEMVFGKSMNLVELVRGLP